MKSVLSSFKVQLQKKMNPKTYDEYTLLEVLAPEREEDVSRAIAILLGAAAASLLNASFHETMEIGERHACAGLDSKHSIAKSAIWRRAAL